MPTSDAIIHVKAVIKTVEEDVEIHGVMHHHILINKITVVEIKNIDVSKIQDDVFCAIRYGDSKGLGEPIAGLGIGNNIELQGVYIEKNHAYPSIWNPSDPVLHYTHHQIGFVVYNGKRYE